MDCTKTVNVTNFDVADYKQYRNLADNGNADAQFELGRFLYESGEYRSDEYRLNKAIEQGSVDAMYYLAIINDRHNHYEEAFRYYKKAADNGHIIAQYKIGMIYGGKYFGVDKLLNPKNRLFQEYEYIKKAAEQGHFLAQRRLGEIYYGADTGVISNSVNNLFGERKIPDAIEWWNKAVENGDPVSRDYLKEYNETGKIRYNSFNSHSSYKSKYIL